MSAGTEVAVPEGIGALESLDTAGRELAVTAYLASARDQLAHAVQASGPAAVAQLKAEIATAAEATKQLGLSKEIQMDAQEMVRRAEFALGKAIRIGQERGEIRRPGQGGGVAMPGVRGSVSRTSAPDGLDLPPSPTDFATQAELSGADADGIYALVDGVSKGAFEESVKDAREEGNLSRANVVRKIKGVPSPTGLTPTEKLAKIRQLAPTGMTSGQIAAQLGVGEPYVRNAARTNGIKITADEVLRGTRRVTVDANHIVSHAVTTLDGLVGGLALIKLPDVDVTQAADWATSLTNSLKALTRLRNDLREMTQ